MKDSTTHLIQVVGTTAGAVGLTLTNINEALTALSLCLATSYTIYHFFKDFKKKNKND